MWWYSSIADTNTIPYPPTFNLAQHNGYTITTNDNCMNHAKNQLRQIRNSLWPNDSRDKWVLTQPTKYDDFWLFLHNEASYCGSEARPRVQ